MTDASIETAADRINALSTVRGINRRELSALSGVNYTTISNWYKTGPSKTSPKREHLDAIAGPLETTTEYLETGGEPPEVIAALIEKAHKKLPLLTEEELRMLLVGVDMTTAGRDQQ